MYFAMMLYSGERPELRQAKGGGAQQLRTQHGCWTVLQDNSLAEPFADASTAPLGLNGVPYSALLGPGSGVEPCSSYRALPQRGTLGHCRRPSYVVKNIRSSRTRHGASKIVKQQPTLPGGGVCIMRRV